MRGRLVVGLGLATLLVAGRGSAFECKTPSNRPFLSLWWGARSLQYGLRADSGLDPDMVFASFEVWTRPLCTDVEIEYVGLVAEADPVSQVFVVRDGWAADGRPLDAVGITETTFSPGTGLIQRATIEVNEEGFAFGDATQGCASGLYDTQAVITHEAGHFLGLGHTTLYSGLPTDPTMAPVVDACETDKRDLEDDDVDGVCFLYPAGGPTGRCGLPDEEGYVSNTPFGCSAGPAGGDFGLGLLLGFGGLGLVRRRAFARDPCGRVRSGG